MFEKEAKKYAALNSIAEQDGIVVFGGEEDKKIPLGELRQAFSIEQKMYNRSINALSVNNAAEVYDACVAPLNPETVLLHIGEADLEFFEQNSTEFDKKYRELISHIKSIDKKCRIAVISLKNDSENRAVSELNKHLKYIAESEQCEFGDIATKRVWNPQETKDIVSFIYSMGFVHTPKNKRPIYDIVKILFCYEPACGE